jgi:hypothetical protein
VAGNLDPVTKRGGKSGSEAWFHDRTWREMCILGGVRDKTWWEICIS